MCVLQDCFGDCLSNAEEMNVKLVTRNAQLEDDAQRRRELVGEKVSLMHQVNPGQCRIWVIFSPKLKGSVRS